MLNKFIFFLSFIALIVIILSSVVWFHNSSNTNRYSSALPQTEKQKINNSSKQQHKLVNLQKNSHNYAKGLIQPKEGQAVKKFTLTARESILELKEGFTLPVWTYNGTVPGAEIRVTQGDFVHVELRNTLKVPVTIHWHGYPLLSAMDGIPGLTQDSVKPGESFTYAFSADVAGTYWYHSHQEGAQQVDKGLYGALIIEPKIKEKVDKEFVLTLDEWTDKPLNEMNMMSMSGSNTKTDPVLGEEEMMSSAYNIYTVNGKSGNLISPLNVRKGDVVKLRFINAGYRSHGIHIPEQEFKVISTDGQNIKDPSVIKNQVLTISPGERYDVQLKITGEDNFIIDAHDHNKYNDQLKIFVNVIDGSGKTKSENTASPLSQFDLSKYGSAEKGTFTLDQTYDVNYKVELNTKVDSNELQYTINGKIFKELPPLKIKKGDRVKFTYDNKSTVDHPMHLHGHFFQLLSKNGKSVKPIIKDTLLIKPNEKYEVAFLADNSGIWVEHCHELHHASAGMMHQIEYIDYKPNYIPDLNNPFNKPE